MAEVIWTKEALDDVDAIAEFIAQDSLFHANKQVNRFFQEAEALVNHPLKGHPVKELAPLNFREITVGKYRLIYIISTSKQVHIISVHHSSRLLQNNPQFKNL